MIKFNSYELKAWIPSDKRVTKTELQDITGDERSFQVLEG